MTQAESGGNARPRRSHAEWEELINSNPVHPDALLSLNQTLLENSHIPQTTMTALFVKESGFPPPEDLSPQEFGTALYARIHALFNIMAADKLPGPPLTVRPPEGGVMMHHAVFCAAAICPLRFQGNNEPLFEADLFNAQAESFAQEIKN